MATACLREVTAVPSEDFKVPALNSDITRLMIGSVTEARGILRARRSLALARGLRGIVGPCG